ncbi:hypothetical protein OB236_38410 [Paenibacillus sp. WQ 127069]|uniref:Uncharacterized protein n=1 Tax=Paenibacillus baimaensis TaxID=2982185 RepID=A0ABT2UTT0_9BACL|nr:hypothetical protein [Paenibacillus sp. WQ 127069]MCU6798015.1 hypothetical protein [Paenibacillus sp. WQ 127069]
MKLYHKLMAAYYGWLADRELETPNETGDMVYLNSFTKHIHHKQKSGE